MKRILFTGFVLLALASGSLAAEPKPNILLIVSDDQGYNDAGFQGSKEIPTPHLDRLAKEGLRCTNGYVSHSFCSPSRAGLLTGRCQARFGYEYNPKYNPNDHRQGVPLSETMLPALMKKSGYVTGWIGKWHQGAAPEFHPGNRGFMETFGFIGGGHHYIDWNPGGEEYKLPILRNGKPVPVKEHLTIAFGKEAAAFIKRHTAEPWFLYLAFNAPHTPHEPTKERMARFKNIEDKKRRAYVAQVSLMDDAIGATLAALNESGQKNRTLVFFFSDNGGERNARSINAPLRDYKGSLYEGGFRVPFVVSWPGHLPAGKDYNQAVTSLDVFPTAMALAGAALPADRQYDGVNLIPYLSGEKSGNPNPRLFWHMQNDNHAALRDGEMKLVRNPGKPAELYNLRNDLREQKNLANSNAAELKKLTEELNSWCRQIAQHVAFIGVGPEKDE